MSRLDMKGRIALGAALTATVACFLTWYAHTTSTAVVTVDAFRASVLGDIYFLCAAATGLILAARAGMLTLGRIPGRAPLICAVLCCVAVGLELILVVAAHDTLHKGILVAGVAAATMVIALRTSDAHGSRRFTSFY